MGSCSNKAYIPSKEKMTQNLDDFEKKEEYDTNIICIGFSILKEMEEKKLQMGDPQFCSKCNVAMNKLSTVLPENQKLRWTCEFCNQQNYFKFEDEEFPESADVLYIIEGAQQKVNADESDISLIFCIDNSGSMNCTTKSKNKQELKYQDSALDIENFKDFMEPWEFQEYKKMISKESKQYISRRQCILAAIEQQLNNIVQNHPKRKIGIVLFDNEVSIIGDGQNDAIVIAGDKLSNKEQCLNESKEAANNLLKLNASQSQKMIIQKLESIAANGKTALGPGLIAAYGLASEGIQGSKIILCTDGLSNVGFGSLETQQAIEVSKGFYEQIAEEAKNKGISISIITIAGEQCNVEALGCLVDKTEGQLTRVNPESLSENFSEVLKEDIIATNVELRVFLHNALKFKNENSESIFFGGSEMRKVIGNVTAQSEISFEYTVKSVGELEELKIDIDKIESVPFQAQIYYNNNKGRFVRIITQYQKVSRNLEEVKDNAEFKILAAHIQQKSSAQILSNNFEEAKKQLDGWEPTIQTVSKNKISLEKQSMKHNMHLYDQNKKQLKTTMEIKSQQTKFLPQIKEEEQIKKEKNFPMEEEKKEDISQLQLVPFSEENELAQVDLIKQKKATIQQYK